MRNYVLIGSSFYVKKSDIQALLPYSSRRYKEELDARKKQKNDGHQTMVFDCTMKRGCKTIVVMNNGVYYLSPHLPQTLVKRIEAENEDDNE